MFGASTGTALESLIDMITDEFTGLIEAGTPFTFTKFGDGEILCAIGVPVTTTGGQPYFLSLGTEVRVAANELSSRSNVYLGLWRGRVNGALFEFTIPNFHCKFVYYNTLILDCDKVLSVGESLVRMYRTIRDDKRPKFFVGCDLLGGAAKMLNAVHFGVGTSNAWACDKTIRDCLEKIPDDSIVMFAAGVASKPWIAYASRIHPRATFIDIGSGLDPLFVGRTRDCHMETRSARELFGSLYEASL